MLRKSVTTILTTAVWVSMTLAQQQDLTSSLRDVLLQQNPEIAKKYKTLNTLVREQVSNGVQKLRGVAQPGDLPVVVHVMTSSGGNATTDKMIEIGIDRLNDAFANQGLYNTSDGVNTGIHFTLAQQDPDGNYTSGINRVTTQLSDLDVPSEEAAMKALSFWDATKYINLWIVDDLHDDEGQAQNPLGFSRGPEVHGNAVDGITVLASTFSGNPDQLKTLVHEMGHYLGLEHTFEGGCENGDCLADGDRVCDTPPDNSVDGYDGSNPPNSCSTDADDQSGNNPFRLTGDVPDLYNNYMDYTGLHWQNSFTPGQSLRMGAFLDQGRTSLKTSSGAVSLCTNPIEPSIVISSKSVMEGETVTFTSTSTDATSWDWKVDGVSFASTPNATYTFNTEGLHEIEFSTGNGSEPCDETISDSVRVSCSLEASFTQSKTEIIPGETVLFSNTTNGASTFQWLLNRTETIGTQADLSYTFSQAGNFAVSLVVSNGLCSDTAQVTIHAGGCGPGKQNNVWFFGQNGMLDFNNEPPTFTTGYNEANFDEGTESVSSVSDENGNLLFSTDGITIYDRNGNVMLNGTGLITDYSATQGSIIVPNPGNSDQYYVFNNYANLYSNLVDMTLNNGLGAVLSNNKNVKLTDCLTTEALTATRHINGTDYWVLMREKTDLNGDGNKDILSFLVNSTGVSANPVHSLTGISDDSFVETMKFTSDGTRLALGIADGSTGGYVVIYDFNRETGECTNPMVIPVNAAGQNFLDRFQIWGIEWSADNSKIYLTSRQRCHMVQYDLNAGSVNDVIESRFYYTLPGNIEYRKLQMGPDGSIYFAYYQSPGFNSIGKIQSPNEAGSNSQVVLNAINVSGILNVQGSFPNFIDAMRMPDKPVITGEDTVCVGSTAEYTLLNYTPDVNFYTWSIIYGDATIESNEPWHALVTMNATDTVKIEVVKNDDCGIQSDTFIVVVVPLPEILLPDVIALCEGSSLTLNPGPGYSGYHWSDGSTGQTLTVTVPGTYGVDVTNINGCTSHHDVTVVTRSSTVINLGPDRTLCDGPVELDAGAGFTSYIWNGVAGGSKYLVTVPGTYTLTVTDACGGTTTDEVVIAECDQGVRVNHVLVFDRSGSMSGEKLQIAKNAGSYFINAVYDKTATNDEINAGMVSYSSSATINHQIDNIITNRDALISSVNNLVDGGSTSIGDGLAKAMDAFEAKYPSKMTTECITLFSDGLQNTSPDPASVKNRITGRPVDKINTLALGSDADGTLLAEIAHDYGVQNGLFFAVTSPDELEMKVNYDAMIASCNECNRLQAQKQDLLPGEVKFYTVNVDEYARVVDFTIIWSGTSNPSFTMTTPGGVGVTENSTPSNVVFRNGNGYKRYRLEVTDTDRGDWTIRIENNSSETIRFAFSIYSDDNSLVFNYSSDKAVYTYPEPMVFEVQLNAGGPAVGVEVSATITNPSGSVSNVIFRDDGQNGDAVANDGLYRAVHSNYLVNGPHRVKITVNNIDGTNGITGEPLPQFLRDVEFDVIVTNAPNQVQFINPYNLKVYARALSADNQKNQFQFYIENAGTSTISNFTARYMFSTAEATNAQPQYQENYTPDSRVVSLTNNGTDYTLELSFSGKNLGPSQLTTGGPYNGEDILLHFAGWPSTWDVSNDYSGKDLTSNFQVTPYINIYDQNGVLIYGYPDGQVLQNIAPDAVLTGPINAEVNSQVTFNASGSSDPDNGPQALTYTWYVDNQQINGASSTVNYTFTTTGTHSVRVVASDGLASDEATMQVTVTDPSQGECDINNSFKLGATNTPKTVVVDGSRCIYIAQSDIASWANSITLQISAQDGKQLSGTIEFNGTSQSLTGWYKVIQRQIAKPATDCFYKIDLGENRTVQINWWMQ